MRISLQVGAELRTISDDWYLVAISNRDRSIIYNTLPGIAEKIDAALGTHFVSVGGTILPSAPAGCSSQPCTIGISAEELEKLGICIGPCIVTGRIPFNHPTWGPTVLVTTQSAYPIMEYPRSYDSRIAALDASGKIRWLNAAVDWVRLAPAEPPIDGTGHLFLNYDPGRYNGVIILNPSVEGFDDFQTLPAPGDFEERFYGAHLKDVNSDGIYEVVTEINTCTPDCASANYKTQIFRWNGLDYISE